MQRLVRVFVGLALGYMLGAGLGGLAVYALSTNTHDKSMEIGMTAFFAAGPIGAIIGAIANGLRSVHKTE